MTAIRPQPEDRLARLLATTETDAAPSDRAALAALRDRAAAEFAAAGQEPTLTHEQRSTMFFMRALTVLAATAAAVLVAFFLREANRPAAELTLGEVHQKLLAADSYRAEWELRDQRRVIWGSGDALRFDGESPTQYAIARGDKFWEINEADNRATPSPSRYYSPQLAAADPFRILDLPTAEVAGVKPQARRNEDGRELLVYFCSLAQPDRPEYEVAVDAATGLPDSVRLLRSGGKPVSDVALKFVAFNQAPADPMKFQVPATLTEDGRIGKLMDHQGLVSLRPLTATRWTPICGETVLRPGDWLRTDFQGANAATVQLAPQTKLILGPGTLVELTKPDQIRIHSGIVEVTASPKSENFSGVVKLSGPAGASLDVGGVLLLRADERGLTRVAKDPPWLAGYKGTTAKESLGSLITMIDGREVPLTVGYHNVSVEIRDQIARTTIEESFVNHTDARLEGQFHFPLPADASISGFGMWIGSKLVEADIVEKQRAREIYETILREKRDPGLLEWTGGNIFKARVFPIEPKSEKRIKIVYTQVLPRKGDSYRYSYALQSELLRQNPLRKLDLGVTVASTQPLAKVESPTHQARGQATEHSARLEFSAQKYTPARDFEVVVTLAGPSQDVTFIPHQRGEDGYFLLMLQPPAEGGVWQRDVVPDGSPLNVIVLADTSASMDRS
ncbi:MAG TPA: VIT domain-containing protein, partial [Pirellulaceae bacterium]|nr:VIT domain-containing protein [Pirellulaceae bacterium]